jgi:hypothetical protein
VKVEKIDLAADLEVPERVAKVLARAKQPLLAQVSDAISSVEVATRRSRC